MKPASTLQITVDALYETVAAQVDRSQKRSTAHAGLASNEERSRIEGVRRQRMIRWMLARLLRERGLTYQEIGDCLGVSRQRVDQLLHKSAPKARGPGKVKARR